jgi:hypothetical protein
MTTYEIFITGAAIFFSLTALYLTILKIIKAEVKKAVDQNK